MTKTKHLEVGQDIYIPTSLYIGHGEDDFSGGLCTITRIEEGISAGILTLFVEIKERPGHRYNYKILLERQEELKSEFGLKRGFQDPDPTDYERWLD